MQPQYAYQSAPLNMPPMMMAGGGLAEAARAVQSRGRGNDTMLVHMTPREVKGLQALAMAHGGSLTTNPDTGLPEAGFLENLLPTIAGIGLNFLFPGSGALIGMGVGAFETMRTGDLGRGLLAGLGAYGGANIGQALSSMGAEAAASTAMQDKIATNLTQAGGEAGLKQTAAALAENPDLYYQAPTMPNIGAGVYEAGQAQAQNFAKQGMFDQLGQGVKAAYEQPGQFGSTLFNQMGTKGTIAAAVPTLTTVSEAMAPKYEMAQAPTEGSKYAGPYYPTEREVRFKPEDDTSTSEFTFFTPSNPVPGYQPYFAAQGGLMSIKRYAEGGETAPPETYQSPMVNLNDRMMRRPDANYVPGTSPEFDYNFKPVEVEGRTPVNAPPAAPGGKGPIAQLAQQLGTQLADSSNYVDLEGYTFDPQTQRLVKKAAGGLTALSAGGRFLEGPGDGTSDSIPAVIGNKQPARLADGEFVIDARTVSEIGNGSSKAGAKKLYAMMDRVHKARRKAGRGSDSKADRFMPA